MTLTRRLRAAVRYFRSLNHQSPNGKPVEGKRLATMHALLDALPDGQRIALQSRLFRTHAAVAEALGVAE